ncbi:helix-turn-helix domain-containing protein [Microcoleus sp. FACHB-68]|uniref:helix-turn-helix domain-containing protein n=1 Tax=Microcoleus sp. FACHB-68 TaxID=2692826 RepID=UPI001688244C|nr:helix-turn-helix domain-containing protein [Microcoleus sp. FACHB-68]MBD1939355.1 helix-turn-helix domain-containing protein [Microcoleus sp. FACHB-68]
MPKRLTIEPHLSLKDLETRYRKAKDPVARSHWQIVWLLAQGKPTHSVVEATGYSATWVRKIAGRYNQCGPEGLGDRRHENPGGEPLLSEQQQQQLWEALQGPAPDGGPWNSRKVAEWMATQIGRQVSDQRGWDYLQRLDISGQRPSRRETVDK